MSTKMPEHASSWGGASGDQAIAVVGMSCRFPGANNVAALWQLLREGMDATSETPAERYDAKAMYSPRPAPGKVISFRSGYVDGIADFDAEFFDMSENEARSLDPQQRLLLMTAWEAFEDAGQVPSALAGSRTGVYVGSMHLDYWDLVAKRGIEAINPSSVYNQRSVLSGRLSYTFDLRGPSVTLDTACSSSLVAVHLACQSLRLGETNIALAAGVNLKLIPDEDVLLSQVRMLAPDGRCKFGDASANGFAPSDGVGVVVLKRLADALADGDRVHAVVLGSAVTNDGASSGSLLAPSVEGHVQMLRWAYENAGVRPGEVDFVEAHGTGTPMIDPIEFAGLSEVLGEERDQDRPLLVGSVKSNIGHTEGAAGIAALIKTALCLRHRQVVPSLHHHTPNPKVPWSELPVRVPTEPHPIVPVGRLAIAGISGQGISSVNCHLVVGEADPMWRRASKAHVTRTLPFAVSARTPAALDDMLRRYITYLSPGGQGRQESLLDVCFSAATSREHHAHRLVFDATTADELVDRMERHLAGQADVEAATVTAAVYRAGGSPDWAEVFEGEGQVVSLPHYSWQTINYWLDDVAVTS
ncbi:Beta-ketoacyl synthase, C-terminal domain [Lentzea waywayandensis]|uniref:Beta-ketoacyl synthase, C-terminal domain n=1 Tax=Lentzea waywayandensis TaxID=84724 RepID=A0A1I6FFJ1_9PSEU|nr:polyketide synthase [Lentzea waywayandensis]SFR28700.1 Beta-ketoacyl synthase, C-terminal domain [Lentzea waywayandensis]